MKLLQLFFYFAILFLFVSCKDKDYCKRSDWLGDYTGTITYNHIMDQDSTDDVRVTVRESIDDFLLIEYETSTMVMELDSLYPLSDCNISLTKSVGPPVLDLFSFQASLFRETDRITITQTIASGGVVTSNIWIDVTRD